MRHSEVSKRLGIRGMQCSPDTTSLALEQNILAVGQLAAEAAAAQNVTPGPLRFMWPDAVASFLFDHFANPR